ncbi:Phorbol-ester/DAG-type domain-containing protein [Camponotus japonicus]
MLKGSLSPYLDTHNEEESSYVTLSNGPYAYVADSTSAEHNSYNHILVDVYFVTPILCKHCDDYIWGTGRVGTKCKERLGALASSRYESAIVKATGKADKCRRWPRCGCAEPRATLGSSSRLAMAIDRAWQTGRSAVRFAGGVVFSYAVRKKPST